MLRQLFSRSLLAAAFALVGITAGAQSVSNTNCRSSYFRAGYHSTCTTTYAPVPKPVSQPARSATRQDVVVRIPGKQKAGVESAATRTDNFCGAGYRMTADGCAADKR